MRIAKFFLLYFVFCAEVRVVAEEIQSAAPVFSPKGCWGHTLPCGIKNIDAKKKVIELTKGSSTSITLAPQAIVNRMGAKTLRLVEGKILVQTNKEVEWTSLYGSWQCKNQCLLVVEKEQAAVRVAALKGDVLVKRTGDEQSYNLPMGFWVVISEVGSDGKGVMEYPQSLPIQSTLKEYSELYEGVWKDFRVEAKKLVPLWNKAAEVASRWHKNEAKRDIAAYYAEQARLLDERRKAEAADLKLRQIFREENYMNQ